MWKEILAIPVAINRGDVDERGEFFFPARFHSRIVGPRYWVNNNPIRGSSDRT